ncbi:ASCH domain-containing protein [Thermomonas sp.]|uniref:ASCH domain-containing protein n=1 Tax=Thermomonas sp. TaxID=1971895 RepID=UPI0035AF07E2
MKALSILQPWAWLIANGHKDIENRCWRTHFRGQFLVHAGKRWGTEQREDLARVRAAFPHIPLPESFDLGGLVGQARIVDCVDDHTSPWFVGEFGFVIADASPLPFTPCRGMLNFFTPALARHQMPCLMGPYLSRHGP